MPTPSPPAAAHAFPPHVAAVLAVAVLGISSSAVLVKGMDAGPLAIAAWRCLFAALILSPALPHARNLSARDALWIVVSGTFLGLHFAAWFASLDYTTVLRSTVLVALVPLWTGLIEWTLFKRRPPGDFWLGILFALGGVGFLTTNSGTGGWYGDALAGVAGILWSVYLLVGQEVRQRVPIATYMGLVSGVASLAMWPLAFATGTAVWGFSATTWGLLVLATLGPQLLGHQGFSYAVKYVPATTVAAIMLLEPMGSSILAALFLGEWPGPSAIGGGCLVILGVLIALRATRRSPA